MLSKYAVSRNFYITSFAIIASAFLFSALFLVNDYFKFKSEIKHDLVVNNELIEQKIVDSFFYTKLIMSYVGRQLANHGNFKDYKFIENVLNGYRMPSDGLMSWSVLSWVDEDNKVAVSRRIGHLQQKVDLSNRSYIIEAKKFPETLQINRPVLGVISGIYNVPIAYGVTDARRKFVGSVVIGIIIDNLRLQLHDTVRKKEISFALLDVRGDVVIESSNNLIDQKLLQKALEKVNKNGEQSFFYEGFYYKKLANYPYVVATSYKAQTLNYSSQRRFTIYLIVMLALIAVMIFFLYNFHKKVILSIKEISGFADKIYRDVPTRKVPRSNIKELDNLAKILHKLDSLIFKNKRDEK